MIQAYQNSYGHIDFRLHKGGLFGVDVYLQREDDVDCFLDYLTFEDREMIADEWIDLKDNNPFYDYILEVIKRS